MKQYHEMTASEKLDDILIGCAQRDWDGYNAEPVDPESVALARKLLTLLPPGTPEPWLCVAPDGIVSAEWSVPTDGKSEACGYNYFNVDMNPKGRSAYFFSRGEKSEDGVIEFDGVKLSPQFLMLLSWTVTPSANPSQSATQTPSDS